MCYSDGMNTQEKYSLFYRVKITVEKTWFVVGVFRNEDYLAFERTSEEDNATLDFFVPHACEEQFVSIIYALRDKGYVIAYEKAVNPFSILAQVLE